MVPIRGDRITQCDRQLLVTITISGWQHSLRFRPQSQPDSHSDPHLVSLNFLQFLIFYVNRDGCHMWGRKCSLFPEHRFHSLSGVHDFTHSLYIHYILLNLSVLVLCLQINDSGFSAWIRLILIDYLTYRGGVGYLTPHNIPLL